MNKPIDDRYYVYNTNNYKHYLTVCTALGVPTRTKSSYNTIRRKIGKPVGFKAWTVEEVAIVEDNLDRGVDFLRELLRVNGFTRSAREVESCVDIITQM